MFFRNRRRLEQDLERIRRNNLPADIAEQEDEKVEQEKEQVKAALRELTFKDYLAMVIAALSIILPFIAIFLAIMAVLLFLVYKFYLGV